MAKINSIAIDVGTSNILIYELGRGIIGRVPAVVAYNTETDTLWKFGEEARSMVGRCPRHIRPIYPLHDGSIKNYALFNQMLQHAIADTLKGRKNHFFSKPNVAIAMPSKINEVELGRVHATLRDADLGSCTIVNRSLAAAIGCNVPMDDPTGFMIVDMGASTTDISIISAGRIVFHNNYTICGDTFTNAIINYIRRRYSLHIGPLTAETLKINNASALKSETKIDIAVAGRLATTNLPKRITITNHDLTDAIQEPLQMLIDEIHNVLCSTDATLVSDICQYGIVISGGPSKMESLADAIGIALNIPTMKAECGDEAVVIGCSYVLQNPRSFKRYLGY